MTAVAASAMALAACGTSSSSEGGSQAPQAPQTVKIGVYGTDLTFAGLYVADRSGGALDEVAKKYNTTFEYVSIPNGSNLISALLGGSVQFAGVPGTAVMGVDSKGGDVLPLVNTYSGLASSAIAPVAAKATHGTDITTFNGKRWGFNRVGAVSQVACQQSLEAQGVPWSNQKQVPQSQAVPKAVFAAGNADIMCVGAALAGAAIDDGSSYEVANLQTATNIEDRDTLTGVVTTTNAFADKYPAFVDDVQAAFKAGLADLQGATTVEQAIALMPTEYQAKISGPWQTQWKLYSSGFAMAAAGTATPSAITATIHMAQAGNTVSEAYEPSPDLFARMQP